MNVYDFDGTVYRGDSTVDFFRAMLVRHPSVILGIPGFAVAYLKYKRRKVKKTELKEHFFRFLRRIPDIDGEVRSFWDRNEKKINGWYLSQRRDDDVIISASPEFLLSEICKRLGTGHLIASRVDRKSGKFTGENCYGPEKVKRFELMCREASIDPQIDEFYSDSDSDSDMAKLAKQAYFVLGTEIKPWSFKE